MHKHIPIPYDYRFKKKNKSVRTNFSTIPAPPTLNLMKIFQKCPSCNMPTNGKTKRQTNRHSKTSKCIL